MDNKSNLPYPKIMVANKNENYGLMILDNIGGMNSELSAINQYIYNLVIISPDLAEIKQVFKNISSDEMHHLNIFMKLALQLGMDPRWWSCMDDHCCYWSPSYLNYPQQIDELLQNAIISEYQAIDKYMAQIKAINDPYIIAILKRIIEDEKVHLQILKHWENKLVR